MSRVTIRDNDVVSTKLRTWIKRHKGTLYYTEVLHSYLPHLPRYEDARTYREYSEKLYDTITERGGRFIKLDEGDCAETGVVLDRSRCIIKGINALRTAHERYLNGKELAVPAKSPPPSPRKSQALHSPTRKRPEQKQKQSPSKGTKAKRGRPARKKGPPSQDETRGEEEVDSSNYSPPRKRFKKNASEDDDVSFDDEASSQRKPSASKKGFAFDMCYHVVFKEEQSQNQEAAGEKPRKPLLEYILNLILSVCNQTNVDPVVAYRILDQPSDKYNGDVEQEPEKERLVRLQLRHRFVTSLAAGISPLDFSHKLVDLWGVKLVFASRKEYPKDDRKPPPPPMHQEQVADLDGDRGIVNHNADSNPTTNADADGNKDEDFSTRKGEERDLQQVENVQPKDPASATSKESAAEGKQGQVDPSSSERNSSITISFPPPECKSNLKPELQAAGTESSPDRVAEPDETNPQPPMEQEQPTQPPISGASESATSTTDCFVDLI